MFVVGLFDLVAKNVFFSNATGTYYLANLTYVQSQLAFLFITVLLSPLAISLFLTKKTEQLRIVPPFYITIISFGWILLFGIWPFFWPAAYSQLIFGGLLLAVGLVEDRVVTLILGRAAERDSIYFGQVIVYAGIEDVKRRLSVPEIRDNLFLGERVEGDATTGYTFRTKRGFSVVNKVSLTQDEQLPGRTSVKFVCYQKGRYNLKVSPAFLEEARKNFAYLIDVIRNRPSPMKIDPVPDLANTIMDPLVDSIIDEMRGYYVRTKRFSGADWVKIIALAGVLLLTIGLLVAGFSVLAGFSGAIDTLLAVSELPDIVRRQS